MFACLRREQSAIVREQDVQTGPTESIRPDHQVGNNRIDYGSFQGSSAPRLQGNNFNRGQDSNWSRGQGQSGFRIQNEQLDARDEHILIPLDVSRLSSMRVLQDSVLQQLTEWLVQVNYTVASRGFKHLVHGNLTESESKNYTSKNILLNLKQLFEAVPQLDLQVKKELMVRINSIEKEVLRQLILRYPQTSSKGASKRVRNMLHRIDNRLNDEFDFLLKNDITFQYRADLDYTSDVMLALNKIISFASQNCLYLSDKLDETYFEVFHELIELIVHKQVEGNEKSFFDDMDHIYTAGERDGLHESVDSTHGNTSQRTASWHKDDWRNSLRINHKIPLETKLFSDEEISTGQFKIRNSSILRIIAKWTFELQDKIANPKELILKRVEKFKLKSKRLISLQNNQKLALYEVALIEKEKIKDYLQLLKDENVMLQALFAEEINKGLYCSDDVNLELFACKVREIYSQCMFKYLCRIIHSLQRIPKEASELYLQRYQDSIPEDELKNNYEMLKDVDLVSFKIGDLLRCKYSCPEPELIRIYHNLMEVSQRRPQVLKLIRVKSRLDQKDNDILINLFFMGRIQCEMQLSINEVEESDTRKSKYYSAYNHLLYELKRSLFGPIGEFACILGEHDPVVSQYVRMEKYGPSIKTTTGNQLSAKHPKLKEIKQLQFICSGCNQLKRLTNSQLFRNKSKKEQEELNEEEEFSEIYEPVKECGDCFIAKLESMDERDIIRKLVGTLHRENTSDYRLLTTHLKLWGLRNIPVRAREDQLHKYLPKEGLVMVKDSKSISLEYFRMFIDEDYIYLSGKIGNAVINFVQINKLLKEKDLESELNAILERMFVFEFDKLVSVEDDEPYEEESERQMGRRTKLVQVAVCQQDCCRTRVVLGSLLDWRQFNEEINRRHIRKILEENKNIMYLSKHSIGKELNEIVLYDKTVEKACKGINIIEAEDSRLKDIEFVSKMVNLSDMYIRYNQNLSSLNGLQNCRNLKILFCNQCKISSIRELTELVSLEELYINQNRLQTLQGLQRCINLVYLSCYWNQIEKLDPISSCNNLEKLDIGFNKIRTMQPISSLRRLKSLAISKNQQISFLEGILNLSQLESIDISHTPISDISTLQFCRKLAKLNCSNTKICSLQAIRASDLVELDIGECSQVTRFDLPKMASKKLQVIIADKCFNMTSLDNIQQCANLKTFLLQQNRRLRPEEFLKIGRCRKIEQLNLNHNSTLKTLEFVESLPQLITLSCVNCGQLQDESFASLRRCQNLQVANFSQNSNFNTMDFLKQCPNIYHLSLNQTSIVTLKPLSKLMALRHLQLKNIPDLTIPNFEYLRDCVDLEKVLIDFVFDVASLKGLQKCLELKELRLGKFLSKPDESSWEKQARFTKELQELPLKIQRAIIFQSEEI